MEIDDKKGNNAKMNENKDEKIKCLENKVKEIENEINEIK